MMKRVGGVGPSSGVFLARERVMEDFPVWMKIIVVATVGGTAVWMLAAMVYFGLFS